MKARQHRRRLRWMIGIGIVMVSFGGGLSALLYRIDPSPLGQELSVWEILIDLKHPRGWIAILNPTWIGQIGRESDGPLCGPMPGIDASLNPSNRTHSTTNAGF